MSKELHSDPSFGRRESAAYRVVVNKVFPSPGLIVIAARPEHRSQSCALPFPGALQNPCHESILQWKLVGRRLAGEFRMVEPWGVEPQTFSLRTRRSTN